MRKKYMQHKRWITSVLVSLLIVSWCAPLCVNAFAPTKPIDYLDLDFTVKEGLVHKVITVPLSCDYFSMNVTDRNTSSSVASCNGVDSISFTADPSSSYNIFVYPVTSYGLELGHLPVGTRISFDFIVEAVGNANYNVTSISQYYIFRSEDSKVISSDLFRSVDFTGDSYSFSYDFASYPDGAFSFVPYFRVNAFSTTSSSPCIYKVTLSNVCLEMETLIADSADYEDQIQRSVELQTLTSGFLLFFVVVVLCYFGYKFFRIFF
ncbi:MAG: hypothetical protein IKK11_03315 [Oscillospiraceae bacterium]|nr:hypothetical protein [Oscillospiraceae bacterium]